MARDATFRTLDRLCREIEKAQERRSIETADRRIQGKVRGALKLLQEAREQAMYAE